MKLLNLLAKRQLKAIEIIGTEDIKKIEKL